MKINIPNQVTLARLILAIGFFALLSLYDASNNPRWILVVGFWVFLVAALADILDGMLARMMKQVTTFGRVVDPVVDKVMICGAFLYFASGHFWNGQRQITDVQAWMVIVILIRELIVSAIRAHAESEGQDFGASWVGKAKMFVQSVTVLVILGQLGWNIEEAAPLRTAMVWITVIVTAASIVSYIRRAHAFLLSSEALGGTAPDNAAPPDSSRSEGGSDP